MKKLVIIFFLFSGTGLFAQFYLQAGYNASWVNADGLNKSVAHYNDTRSFLTKNMEEPGMMKGFGFTVGGMLDFLLFEMRYFSRSADISAEGNIEGQTVKRDLTFGADYFCLGTGFGSFEDDMGYAVGLSADFVFLNAKTTVTGGSETEALDEFSPNITPFFILIGDPEGFPLGFTLRAYYSFSMLDTTFNDLNSVINPGTYEFTNNDEFSGSVNGFGIELTIGFVFLADM